MKLSAIISILLFPVLLIAQYNHPLAQPVDSKSYLLSLGHNTILINSLDLNNEAQKWTTFDSALNIIVAKKLITPEAENIISQTYLEGVNSIIRIDQLLFEGLLKISAYIFDVQGNLTNSVAIEGTPVGRNKLLALPFLVVQSPNKQNVALVQTQAIQGDSLAVANIVFNNQLNIVTNTGFIFPYDTDLYDLYMPLVNDQQTVYLPLVDKFNSYKLGSEVLCYELNKDRSVPQKIEFDFDRKKIKGLNFNVVSDTLFFSALYSEKLFKEDVAGILYTGYAIGKKQKLPVKEYAYGAAVKGQLKKLYSGEGRKGNFLNYLSLLPESLSFNAPHGYGILLPHQDEVKKHIEKPIPPPLAGLGEIKQKVAFANSLVGTQPRGYSQPLTADQANVYAALNHQSIPANIPNSDQAYYSSVKSSSTSPLLKQRSQYKNLLFFSFNDSLTTPGNQFIKIKTAADPAYQFFSYYVSDNGYGTINYHIPGFGKPYLKSTEINHDGVVQEKKVFEDRSKVILQDYPYLINGLNLITFYEDKTTSQMGLIKIKL